MKPNPTEYFRSLAAEISAQSHRVRFLIGDRHWLSDGHHKEYVLSSVIGRHLPEGMLLTRGFVADLNSQDPCSREQDLMVVDVNTCAPLFNQGGLVVAAPESVVATISVKSTMTPETISETIANQVSARRIIADSGGIRFPHFSAGFFFEPARTLNAKPEAALEMISKGFSDIPMKPFNHARPPKNIFGPELFCCGEKYVYTASSNSTLPPGVKLLGYTCDGLALAILIASLVEHVSEYRGTPISYLSGMIECAEFTPFSTS